MKVRKKPVVVDAEQYHSDEREGTPTGVCFCINGLAGPHIHTLEGLMNVSDGDWIIKGVKGEFYPCKPDIFEQTYEIVTAAHPGEDRGKVQG